MMRQRLFSLILLAYPRQFRHAYGAQMTQLFQDCYRFEKVNRGLIGVGALWCRTLLDLARAAPREHLESMEKEHASMRNLGKNALGLLGSIALIVIAFLLLSYGRKNEVSTILVLGRTLDALVTTGIVANLIIFLLMSVTRLNQLRIALWTLIAVHGVLLLVAVLLGSKVDPNFQLGGVLLGYVVSFVFWLSFHWIWSKASAERTVSAS